MSTEWADFHARHGSSVDPYLEPRNNKILSQETIRSVFCCLSSLVGGPTQSQRRAQQAVAMSAMSGRHMPYDGTSEDFGKGGSSFINNNLSPPRRKKSQGNIKYIS